jgi:hypothetical protein
MGKRQRRRGRHPTKPSHLLDKGTVARPVAVPAERLVNPGSAAQQFRERLAKLWPGAWSRR